MALAVRQKRAPVSRLEKTPKRAKTTPIWPRTFSVKTKFSKNAEIGPVSQVSFYIFQQDTIFKTAKKRIRSTKSGPAEGAFYREFCSLSERID